MKSAKVKTAWTGGKTCVCAQLQSILNYKYRKSRSLSHITKVKKPPSYLE